MKLSKIIEIIELSILLLEIPPLPQLIDWQDDFISKDDVLNIGMGYYGIVGMDLEMFPHAFIAGKAGCGKSNILKCMIHQAIKKNYDIVLIDFKRGVSFSRFDNIIPVCYEYKDAMQVLSNLVAETMSRLDLLRKNKVESIKEYNIFYNGYFPRKIVFIDELAELLKPTDKEISKLIYDAITTLTRLSRAVGIHLIMGIHRPDSTIISGQIKNNVPFRVCGKVVDKEPSTIMLDSLRAKNLPDIRGRFIVKDDKYNEVQCFYYR